MATIRRKNEWVTEREIADRVTQYRHLDRAYYIDKISQNRIDRNKGYMDRLLNWNNRN